MRRPSLRESPKQQQLRGGKIWGKLRGVSRIQGMGSNFQCPHLTEQSDYRHICLWLSVLYNFSTHGLALWVSNCYFQAHDLGNEYRSHMMSYKMGLSTFNFVFFLREEGLERIVPILSACLWPFRTIQPCRNSPAHKSHRGQTRNLLGLSKATLALTQSVLGVIPCQLTTPWLPQIPPSSLGSVFPTFPEGFQLDCLIPWPQCLLDLAPLMQTQLFTLSDR